jgi:beta-xylosidase
LGLAHVQSSPTHGEWGDQGNGFYANPILPMDFSDLDAIRVGADYYAISSTIQFSPGMVVLRSKDLVNWTVVGHVVPDLTRLDPNLNWDKMDQYGKGVWAGSLRFHDGKFWVYFNVPTTGFFVSTAKNPAGPWTPVRNLWRVEGWDDPCPFWDDDGQGYLVATNFSDGYKIHLFKLSADGMSLLRDSDQVIHQSKGSEANKLYKINGIYYHLYSDVQSEGRVLKMNRSRSLSGPWETKQLIHVNRQVDKEPNQGGLVELPSGKWFFFTHQGTGDWEGRAGVLLPVTWISGWPLIGPVGEDGIGRMVWRAAKPIAGFPLTTPAKSDDFEGRSLAPEWEWNHQPRSDKWSLTERPGFLRLHAFPALRDGDFWTTGNILTQRSLRTSQSEVTTKLELAGMAEGQEAGLAHFAKSYCTFGVAQAGGVRRVIYNQEGQITRGPEISQKVLWLRSTWDYNGQSQFSYSSDGKTFVSFGQLYRLTWGRFRGDRVGFFTVNQTGESGFIDVDWFRYEAARK